MAPGEMGVTWSVSDRRWLALMAEFERPSLRRALWQILDTFVPYMVLWALMTCTVHYGYPYWVTLALSLLAAGLLVTIGLKTYLAIQLPIILIGGAAGIWLFYVQHQFEKTYWAPHKVWNSMAVAIEGSSFYRLPKVLQWFSGNIGLHHVHHLRPRIPNYNLQRCYDAVAALRTVAPLTLLGSLRGLWLHLWDERQQKIVSFRALRHI